MLIREEKRHSGGIPPRKRKKPLRRQFTVKYRTSYTWFLPARRVSQHQLGTRMEGRPGGNMRSCVSQCPWGSGCGAPLQCPAFLLSTPTSCFCPHPPPHPLPPIPVSCSMNKYYVVWCSLLFDMKKGNSLGWRRGGRETPFFTRCIKHGYTDLNSQKSNKTAKIMIKQLLG